MEDKTRNNEDFEQNQLFEENPLISDKKDKENKKNSNLIPIVLTSVITSLLIISGFYFLGFFEEVVIPEQETITITETIKERELVIPRVDSSEVVTIAEIATQTIVQILVGIQNEEGEFISQGGGSGVVLSKDGLIITNHHVLDMENEIAEDLSDDRRPRQHRGTRARQRHDPRSAPFDTVLHLRPRTNSRSLSGYRCRQHVGQCRA